MRAKLEICNECGTREADWEDDDMAYVADARRCLGCEQIAIEQDRIEEIVKSGEGSGRGIKIGLLLRRIFEAREAEREAEANS